MVVTKNDEFFRQFNEAFFSGDAAFISRNVTNDVVWTMVGNEPIIGKQALLDAAFGVGDYTEMEFKIDCIISEGLDSAVKGTMATKKGGNEKTYAFCDFYRLNNLEEVKITEMTSFVIEISDN